MRFFLVIWCGPTLSLVGSAWSICADLVADHDAQLSAGAGHCHDDGSVAAHLGEPLCRALVDRWPRRTVLIVADTVTALALVWLLALYASGAVQTWHVYLLLLLRATAGNFHWPAMQASTTMLVPERHLARVAGLTQTVQGPDDRGGAGAGALLYELLPMQGILAVEVGTAACAVVAAAVHRRATPPAWRAPARGRHHHPLRSVEGLLIHLALARAGGDNGHHHGGEPGGQPVFCADSTAGEPALWRGRAATGLGAGALGWGLVSGACCWRLGGFKRRIVTASVGSVISGIGFHHRWPATPPTAVGARWWGWPLWWACVYRWSPVR